MIVFKIIATLFMLPLLIMALTCTILILGMGTLYRGMVEGDWCEDVWAELPEWLREIWDSWKNTMTE